MSDTSVASKSSDRKLTQKSEFTSRLIQLLESPEWISNIDSFVERECIVFEPEAEEHESYRQVHSSFKALIDKMLHDYRTSHGTSLETVKEAIDQLVRQTSPNNMKAIIQPLLLYDSYEAFQEAMTNQNLQMQMFAMEALQKQTGMFPLSGSSEMLSASLVPDDDEHDALLQDVLRRSKEEYDELQRLLREEEEAIERALRESERLAALLAGQAKVSVHDLRALVEQVEGLSVVPEEEDAGSHVQSASADSVQTPLAPALANEDGDKFVSAKNFISPEELQRRQAYLRAQRDKLHSKKEALKERGEMEATKEKTGARPIVSGSRKVLSEKLKAQVAEHPA